MSTDLSSSFSMIVTQFITTCCDISPDLSVPDAALFPRFRSFWLRSTQDLPYSALLGQFRVTMTQLGFHSSGGKRPRWKGLALKEAFLDSQ
jgi:hypothetical protein